MKKTKLLAAGLACGLFIVGTYSSVPVLAAETGFEQDQTEKDSGPPGSSEDTKDEQTDENGNASDADPDGDTETEDGEEETAVKGLYLFSEGSGSENIDEPKAELQSAATHTKPYGVAAIEAEHAQLTADETGQSYTLSYSESDREGRTDDYNTPSSFKMELDNAFIAKTVWTGSWNGYTGNVTVNIYNGSDELASYTVGQQSPVSFSGFENITRITVGIDGYADTVSGLTVSGDYKAETAKDPVTFRARYSATDGSAVYAVASESTPTTYITLVTPKIDVSGTELYYGDSTEAVLTGFINEGYTGFKSALIDVKIPEGLKVTAITAPAFGDAEVTLLINGEEMEDSAILGDDISSVAVSIVSVDGSLDQTSDFVIAFMNADESEDSVIISADTTVTFKNGEETVFSTGEKAVSLKGIYVEPEPEPEPDPDPDPSVEPDPVVTPTPTTEPTPTPEEEEQEEEKEKETEKTETTTVVDRSGLNIGTTTVRATGTASSYAYTGYASDEDEAEEQQEKLFHGISASEVETAEVEDVSDRYEQIVKKAEETGLAAQDAAEEEEKDPVIEQEKKLGEAVEKKNMSWIVPVVIIGIAVAAVASAFLIITMIQKRKHNLDADDDETHLK